MADYTVVANGTATSLAAAIDGDPSIPAECLSLAGFHLYGGGASAGDHFLFADNGGEFRGPLNTPVGGTSADDIYLDAYVGDSPMFNGSILVAGASMSGYQWQPSTTTPNEYYLTDDLGNDPGISEPNQLYIVGSARATLSDTGAGTLNNHEWAFGDNETPALGYDTIYFRDDSGSPNSSGVELEASDASQNYIFYLDEGYVTVDGIDCKYSNGHGFRITGNDDNITIKNSVSFSHYLGGFQVYTADDCELNNCEAYDCCGSNFNINGYFATRVERLLITGCKSHDAAINVGATYTEASGLKAFGLYNSTITKSQWYDNPSGGLRFDGTTDPEIYGCDSNLISENELYGNGGIRGSLYFQLEIEWSDSNLVLNNFFYDPWGGGPNVGFCHSGSDNNYFIGNILNGSYASDYRGCLTFQTFAGVGGTNHAYNNIIFGAYQAIRHNTTGTTKLRNNSVSGSLGLDLNIKEVAYVSNVDSDYNCFTGEGSLGSVRVYSTDYTLAEWYALSGNDEHSFDDDPQFTNPDNDDFSLASNSSCKGTGVRIKPEYGIGVMPGSVWPSAVKTGYRDDY